jgi:hypothetical protein
MKVHIINYEEGANNGILSKFAKKMYDILCQTPGIFPSIGNKPREGVDINHHINYAPYRPNDTKNTLMVTHIWEGYKLDKLREHMKTADLGICMSQGQKNELIEWGLDEHKLPVILPAHDGLPRRHQIVAICTNVYPDGCKRQWMFEELVKTLDPNQWAFRIMGSGWEKILEPLVLEGLQVDYFHDFNYDNHKLILDSSDYLLYFGKDEGAMSVLDAKQAGLKIIAPNVGFHKEIGIDYPFDTQEELNEIFTQLNPNPVRDWTWKRYVDEHIALWNKLMKQS